MDTITTPVVQPCDIREIRVSRGLSPDDVNVILEMAAASGAFSSDALMAAEDMAWNTAYGEGAEPHTFLKATVSETDMNRIVGFICFGPISPWRGAYEMYGVALDPEFQRLGIGTALVAEMKRQIAAAAGSRIYLETGDGDAFEKARLFYEANSFIREYRFQKHFIPNDGGAVFRFTFGPNPAVEHFQ